MSQAVTAIKDGALVFVSHSGGKDSQAMYAHLRAFVPADQIVVVHANLGEVEWSGVIDHIKANIDHDLNVVRAAKTLLEMVEQRFERRPDVPSPHPVLRVRAPSAVARPTTSAPSRPRPLICPRSYIAPCHAAEADCRMPTPSGRPAASSGWPVSRTPSRADRLQVLASTNWPSCV